MTTAPPQVYPSVDWITCTTHGDSDADYVYERARALAVEQQDAGDRLKPWGANGYKGFGLPHIRCGTRNAEVLIELSGELAGVYWRDFYARCSNVSRLDTCVTVTFPRETRDLAKSAYLAPRVRPRPGFPAIRKTLWEQADAGQTLYLGSPKSSRMGRLYDKTAESDGAWPAWSWRWELQERRDMGGARARMLDGADDMYRAIRAGVHGFFSYHGCPPWFNADGPAVFAPARRARSDMRRYGEYLARCIAPGVRRGIDRGFGPLIIAALGLDREQLVDALAQLELQLTADPLNQDRSTNGGPAWLAGNVPNAPTLHPISLNGTRSLAPARAARSLPDPATSAATMLPTSRTGSI